MTLIDGKAVANKVKEEVRIQVEKLKSSGKTVCLAVIIVGDDPASKVYVKNKHKDCEECGIASLQYALPEQTSQDELLELINELNNRDDVDGILVQLPVPKHIDSKKVIAAISPKKDVDAFHAENVGRIVSGDYDFLPCTPAGVMELLKHYNIEISGKDCVVVGRSDIVGKPMAMLLMHADGTVTVCHTKTKNLSEKLKNADIVVVAMKKPKYIKADMLKDGAVVIDVGIHRLDDGSLCGDVDFDDVKDKVSFITPVPGGVGPMTRAILMKNTLKAAQNK